MSGRALVLAASGMLLAVPKSAVLFTNSQLALVVGLGLLTVAMSVRCLAEGFLPGTPVAGNERARLIQDGAYAHCRNPLEVSGLLALLGLLVIGNSWLALIIVLSIALILIGAVTIAEERSLSKRYAKVYAIYRHEVPRFGWRLSGTLLTLRATGFSAERVLRRALGPSCVAVLAALGFASIAIHRATISQWFDDRPVVLLIAFLATAAILVRIKSQGRPDLAAC